MRLLLISDTHGRTSALEALLIQYAFEVDLVCHMGDHAKDMLKFQSKYPSLQMVVVAGNCDYEHGLFSEQIINIGNKRILITHGHFQNVKSNLQNLVYYAQEKNVDGCFFGHTHQPICDRINEIFIINPGSLTEPRGGVKRPSYGIVNIDEDTGEIKGEIINI
ncbi:MAG: metallophosphoesterase [Defluviitaleaceae bacterium]|nr:metallophosphoesterase [Defluviitaleaceae bacterium]